MREKVVFNVPNIKNIDKKFICVDFTLTHVSLVRDYMQLEFSDKIKNPNDLEWIIDDLIFLFLFVGNDFIPTLPSISIRNNSLHTIFTH